MNTTPDETLLALWLDDELSGEELARVESWAAERPEQLAAREEVRAWRKTMASAIPAAEEPPYADFFNSRITRAIRELPVQQQEAAPVRVTISLWRWLFPISAVAGMAFAFWIGTKAHSDSSAAPGFAKATGSESAPAWYTPEQGVDAQWITGKSGSSSVILLQGLSAIPDAQDFSETAYYQHESESSSTAGNAGSKPAQ